MRCSHGCTTLADVESPTLELVGFRQRASQQLPSQHQGQLFLPFTVKDPKTAAVVSKVPLLACDREIQDPTMLQQIAAPCAGSPAHAYSGVKATRSSTA